MAEQEKTIAFVLYRGMTALDIVGPLQIFSVLEFMAPEFKPVVVAANLEPVETDTPLKLVADKTFADVPAPFVVVVPGGDVGAIRAMADDVP